MANSPQAKKRVRQNEKNRKKNASQRSTMRTALKRVITSLSTAANDVTKTEIVKINYRAMVSKVDQSVSKGLIHRNKAARHKSRLNARLKLLNTA